MAVKKRGKKWAVVYPEPANKSGRGYATFDKKWQAEQFEADHKVKAHHGDWLDPRAGQTTVREYGDEWLAGHGVGDRTRVRYRRYLDVVNEDLGGWSLSRLAPAQLRKWQLDMLERFAPSTVSAMRGVFATMLRTAVTDRKIGRSPLDDVPTVRVDRGLIVPLAVDVIAGLRDCITPRYAALVELGAGTGMRIGEALGLTVDRVDFLRKRIRVDRQLVSVEAGRPVFAPPKTKAGLRWIPVAQVTIDAIAAHLARYPSGPDGVVFTTRHGGAVSFGTFDKAWHNADVKRWALDDGRPLDNRGRVTGAVRAAYELAHPDGVTATFHDLRHFYASSLLAGGRSVKEVQERLGHKDPSETLRTYSHLMPGNEDGTRDAIAAALTRNSDAAIPGYGSTEPLHVRKTRA